MRRGQTPRPSEEVLDVQNWEDFAAVDCIRKEGYAFLKGVELAALQKSDRLEVLDEGVSLDHEVLQEQECFGLDLISPLDARDTRTRF